MKLPRKEEKIEELEAEDVEETQWDIKRVVIGLAILLVFASIAALMLFPGDRRSAYEKEAALGVATEAKPTIALPPLPGREDIEKVIENAQESLSSITAENVDASDSAIQKIINDLQSLQKSKDIGGAFCSLVCSDK